MSKSAIIVLIVVALVLGGTLLLINQQQPSPGGSNGETTPTGPAFEVSASDVVAMTFTEPGGVTRSVYRMPLGSWVYAESPVTAEPEQGWPVDVSRVRSALQTLSPIPAAGVAESATVSDDAPIIELRLSDGSTRSLQVERESVGGNTLARVDGERTVLIPASSVADLLSEGPEAWRIRSPLAGVAVDASRITITAGNERVALAKVENRWIMRGPVSARADEAVIRAVLDELLKMRIAEFAGDEALVSQPIVTVELERDDAIGTDGSVRRVTARSLAIGAAADPGNATRFATARGTDLPPITPLVVERGDIITDQQFMNLAEATAYLSKNPVHERPADIGIILFRPMGDMNAERGFRRDLEGWNEMNPDGGMRTAELPDRLALESALTMLATTPGKPQIASRVESFRPLTRVELFTLDGSDLGSLQVGYTEGVLSVRRGTVLWLYPDTAAPAMFMLPDPSELEPEPEREPSDASEADSEDNK